MPAANDDCDQGDHYDDDDGGDDDGGDDDGGDDDCYTVCVCSTSPIPAACSHSRQTTTRRTIVSLTSTSLTLPR